MFGSSFSPSWTYMVILFKNNEEGHKVIEFTLPSNQTEYPNDSINAYRYFVHNLLKDLGYAVLGVVSSEDYINIERVGISKELACKFALEREAKEQKKPHSFYSEEFFKILKEEEEQKQYITAVEFGRAIIFLEQGMLNDVSNSEEFIHSMNVLIEGASQLIDEASKYPPGSMISLQLNVAAIKARETVEKFLIKTS
jgi:hypothetical protein